MYAITFKAAWWVTQTLEVWADTVVSRHYCTCCTVLLVCFICLVLMFCAIVVLRVGTISIKLILLYTCPLHKLYREKKGFFGFFFTCVPPFPGHRRTCLTTWDIKLYSYFRCQKVGCLDQFSEHHHMTRVKSVQSYVEISQSHPFHLSCIFSWSLNYSSAGILHNDLCLNNFCTICS